MFSSIPSEFNPVLVAYQNAWTLYYLGRKAESLAVTEAYLARHPEDVGGLVTSVPAMLAAAAGDALRAEQKIKLAVEHDKGYGHFHHTAYDVASAYALLGKTAPALQWLETAAQDGLPCYPLFEKDPNLDRIRRDPGFIAFLARERQHWEAFQRLKLSRSVRVEGNHYK